MSADLGIGTQRSFRIPDMFSGIFTLGFVGFIVNFAFPKIALLAMARHQRRNVKGEM